jgi:hypothetical protein
MDKASLEASLAALDTWIQVFAVIVAIGIVGEVGFGVKHWILNRRLQRIQHSEDQEHQAETARLNKEAGDARKAAGEALERAGKAQENLAGAHERAAAANERAAKAEQHAAEANKKAEEERLARVRIEQRLAPRSLGPAQQRELSERLRPFAGRSLDIFMYGETPEIVSLTMVIKSTVESAGWNVRSWTVTAGGAVTGILVGTRTGSDASAQKAAQALIAALNSEGVSSGPWKEFSDADTPGMLTGPPWSNNDMAPIRMLLGTKP